MNSTENNNDNQDNQLARLLPSPFLIRTRSRGYQVSGDFTISPCGSGVKMFDTTNPSDSNSSWQGGWNKRLGGEVMKWTWGVGGRVGTGVRIYYTIHL